jgi:hypothetical protein
MFVPLEIKKYPLLPQVAPHEFFMFQNFYPFKTPYPVAKTA